MVWLVVWLCGEIGHPGQLIPFVFCTPLAGLSSELGRVPVPPFSPLFVGCVQCVAGGLVCVLLVDWFMVAAVLSGTFSILLSRLIVF